jgi:large subunit ribosomal protein L9
MEIILLDHIEDLGMVGQTVRVKDGYARNFLFPRKLACPATKENLNYYKSLILAKQRKIAKAKAGAEEHAKLLEAVSLTFTRRSRDQDARLFGSVTNSDVAAALVEKGFEIERRRITLSEPIKRIGDYTASVRVHPEVVAQLTIKVVSEEETKDAG